MQLKRSYQNFLNYLAKSYPELRRSIEVHLLIVLTTGFLMWGYSFLAFFTISDSRPAIVGFIASTLHALSPFSYRISGSVLLNSSIMLAAGFAHAVTFSYFTGGFLSVTIFWFGIMPFIGALAAGQRGAILWFAVSLLAVSLFLVTHINGFAFPVFITSEGYFIAHVLIVLGMIFLTSSLSFFHLKEEARQRHNRAREKDRVENLFRVLSHDLSNPLAVLQMSVEQAQTCEDEVRKSRNFEISQRAISNIIDITQNVRRMYAVEEGKTEVLCTPMSLNSAIEQIRFLFQASLAQKNLELHYDEVHNSGAVVIVDPTSFVHQVLGNILSNAVKFSRSGKKIYITTEAGPERFIRVNIKDEGIGMSSALREKIFDVSAIKTRSGTAGEQGTGYGMHLMKTFVEKYDGYVQVTSQDGEADHWTNFTLTLKGHLS
jgi:signal transduction histidine kinase